MTNSIMRRPYQKQEEKDLELCKAYQLGINDERKNWKEKEKVFSRLKFIEGRKKEHCFCQGDKRWRRFCAECQIWLESKMKK